MASVASVNILQDGVRGLWIRKNTGGSPSGPFYKFAGINSVSTTRNVTERELPGDNVTFKKDSKFNDYEITLNLWTTRPDLLPYLLGGTLTEAGDITTFEEDANSSPFQFEMFVESDAVGENNESVAIGEHYYVCNVSNFNNAKTSAEYVTFEVTVIATANSDGNPRKLIFDANELPFELTSDATAPLLQSTTPAAGSTLAALTTDIVLTYDVDMDSTTAGTKIEVFQASDGTEFTAFTASVTTTAITLAPDSDWPTSETLIVSVLPGLEGDDGVKIGVGNTYRFTTPAS